MISTVVLLCGLTYLLTPGHCQPPVTVNIGTQSATPSTAGGSGLAGASTSPSIPPPGGPQALPSAVAPSQTASVEDGYTQLKDGQIVNGVVGKVHRNITSCHLSRLTFSEVVHLGDLICHELSLKQHCALVLDQPTLLYSHRVLLLQPCITLKKS